LEVHAMSGSEAAQAIAQAVGRVKNVRTVPLVRLAHEDDTERAVVVVRVGLPPLLPLSEVATVIAHVQLTVARLAPSGAAVHVEPDVAADEATPTEAIVIRALE
jgi:divalent metal cation (Fe/Co/Zn/Cd) transporter